MPPLTLTFRGKTQTVAAWSKETGLPDGTIRSRLTKLGLSVGEALSRPADRRFRAKPARPAARAKPAPKLLRDERGRGVARWTDPLTRGRRKRVFGPWGAAETAAAYNRWAAEWHAARGAPPAAAGEEVGVAGLILRHLAWAESHYTKHGKKTTSVHRVRAAVAEVNELYGDTPAAAFAPTSLLAVQARWVAAGLSARTCNDYLSAVARCWSWGAGRGLVPGAVADALKHVPTLKPGRAGVRRRPPVRAATDADLAGLLDHLDPDPARRAVFAAMVRVQRLTGMRPGEVLELRAADVDRSREPWLYRPASGGKTLHLDRDRRVWLGPLARGVLGPLLDAAGAGEPVFRLPRKRGSGWLAVRPEVYRRALAVAAAAAGVPAVRPNQLRHARATEVQRRYEDDAAVAAVLGNSKEVARQVYVDNPADAVAKRIAEATG